MNFQIQSEPYSESREQGIDDLPFLEQSRINNTYKKESAARCGSVRGSRQTVNVSCKTQDKPEVGSARRANAPTPRDVPEAWLSSLNALYGLLQQSDDFKNSVWWLPFICQTVLKHWLTYKPSPLHSENKPFGFLWLTSRVRPVRKAPGWSSQPLWLRSPRGPASVSLPALHTPHRPRRKVKPGGWRSANNPLRGSTYLLFPRVNEVFLEPVSVSYPELQWSTHEAESGDPGQLYTEQRNT